MRKAKAGLDLEPDPSRARIDTTDELPPRSTWLRVKSQYFQISTDEMLLFIQTWTG